MVREQWVHAGSVARDPLCFARAITHAHITRDERIAWLRANNNALHALDLEQREVVRTIALDRSLVFAGFIESDDALAALVHSGEGAWRVTLDALGESRESRARVCSERVCAASIAPDHRSAALVLGTGALLVTDGAGQVVHRSSRAQLSADTRPIALTQDRVLLCDGAEAAVLDLRRDERAPLNVDATRVYAAVDREHVLAVASCDEGEADARWTRCVVIRCLDGHEVTTSSEVTAWFDPRRAALSIATVDGSLFATKAQLRSVIDPRQNAWLEDDGCVTLAVSARWAVKARFGERGAIRVHSRERSRSESGAYPLTIWLSPDGEYLLEDRAFNGRVWHTSTGALVGERGPYEIEPAPQWRRDQPALIVVDREYSEHSQNRRLSLVALSPAALRLRASIDIDDSVDVRALAVSPDGQRALLPKWSFDCPRRWSELALDEATATFAWSGDELSDSILDAAFEVRFHRDGALEALCHGRWWRRLASGWVDLAPQLQESFCFAGPGVLGVDGNDALCIATADGRMWPAPKRMAAWAADELVFAAVDDGVLSVTDLRTQQRWTIPTESDSLSNSIERETATEQFALSADGRTLAVVDGPEIKIFRRTPV